jgi:hypothetical protein
MTIPHLATFAASLFLLTACHEQTSSSAQAPTEEAQGLPKAPSVAGVSCYQYSQAKDTIRLTLNSGQGVLTGRLLYNIFEKDRNSGTVRGTMQGDTLFATYTFQSEGMVSKREVAFLRRGSEFIAGYGEVMMRNGQEVFQRPHQLHFDSKTALLPVPCPN